MKILIIIISLSLVSATLGPNDKKNKPKKETPNIVKQEEPVVSSSLSGQNDLSVVERNLVNGFKIPSHEIVKYSHLYCKKCANMKTFKNKVLGYVTPWNSKGYDVSKLFAHKLDLISPVWLQIVRKGHHHYELTGTHDIDSKWMKNVHKTNPNSLFVPRILFENLKTNDLHALFNDEQELEALGKMLVQKSIEYQFGGYVLEIYSQLGGHGKTQINHLGKLD